MSNQIQVTGVISAGRQSVIDRLANVDANKVDIDSLELESKAVFLIPPDYDEWTNRMKHRPMDQDQIQDALIASEKALQTALENDSLIFVVNDDLDEASAKVDQVAAGKDIDSESGRQVAWEILNKVKQVLYS